MYIKREIGQSLESNHVLFRAFWDYGAFDFADHIERACVTFDKSGGFLQFLFNREFFESIDLYTKTFVTAHEMLHIIWGHGDVASNTPAEHQHILNKALDLVVNHHLVNACNIERSKINQQEELCWVDTVFPNQHVPNNLSWEEYFAMLKAELPETSTNLPETRANLPETGANLPELTNQGQSKHSHSYLPSGDEKELVDEMIKNIVKGCIHSEEEFKELFPKNHIPGSASGWFSDIKKTFVQKKKKWETIVTHWEKVQRVASEKSMERWDHKEPRLYHILEGNDFFLPSEKDIDDKAFKKCMLPVFFFLDTSGSCFNLKTRFFKAARSLDPKCFKVRLFSFDTRVEELDINSGKVYGGGGTSFHIIEGKIQEIIKADRCKYPTVWIITDGYGTSVNPKHPEKWNWFLTNNGSKQHIPAGSKVFKLTDFE